jgi:hypothetical protein
VALSAGIHYAMNFIHPSSSSLLVAFSTIAKDGALLLSLSVL